MYIERSPINNGATVRLKCDDFQLEARIKGEENARRVAIAFENFSPVSQKITFVSGHAYLWLKGRGLWANVPYYGQSEDVQRLMGEKDNVT